MQRRKRREFTPDIKARTVELLESSGKSLNQICRELDLTPSAVRRWVAQAKIDAGRAPGLTSDERAELARLRKENKVLREEREILKKVALGSERLGKTSVLMCVRGGWGGTGAARLHGGGAGELWNRWRAGASVSDIARALDRAPGQCTPTCGTAGPLLPTSWSRYGRSSTRSCSTC
jgi:transposase